MTEINWQERAVVVECLAKRICRDLRHALDDVPADSPMKEMMVERYQQFKADLGDTSEYVHALHYTIRQLEVEIAGLKAPPEGGLLLPRPLLERAIRLLMNNGWGKECSDVAVELQSHMNVNPERKS